MVLLAGFLLFVILEDRCQLVLTYDAMMFSLYLHLRNKTGLTEMMLGTNILESSCHLKKKNQIVFLFFLPFFFLLKFTDSKGIYYYKIKSGFGE